MRIVPRARQGAEAIDRAVADAGSHINSRMIYKDLVQKAYSKIPEPKQGHKHVVNTTNIWHLRELILESVMNDHGKQAGEAAEKAIRQSITCYAAKKPTASDVQEAVFEILHPDGTTEKEPSRSQRRTELLVRLKQAIAKRKSWEDVDQLIIELEELL